MSKPVVILPILNELDNIKILLKKITKLYPNLHILIIDANSTDGSVESIRKIQEQNLNITIKEQGGLGGFGDAIRQGFQVALKEDFDPIITMDGDLSHDPVYIKDFLALQDDYDLIIGSRYINGVRVEGWQFRKLLYSKLANMYISYILVRPIWDFTSGFRLYRKKLIETIDLDSLENNAYIIQIQLLYLAYQKRKAVKEIPIIFREFYPGVSKISHHSKYKTFKYVLKYRAPFFEIFRHLTYLKKDYKRFINEYEDLVNPPTIKKDKEVNLKEKYSISIGVMAYNEEELIGKCLDALLNQDIKIGHIKEIIVVSSGSTDRTNEIVLSYSNRYNKIKLIVQLSRMGKANAINEFLAKADGDIVVLESADTITKPNTIQKLIEPFRNIIIGMCGVRSIPINEKKSFIGFAVHKLWELHHQIALDNPKCGEMIAFRNILAHIPNYTAVDEAAIEAMITRLGFELAYAPEAILYNKGPENIKEFIKQRRRIASGHLHLQTTMGYRVSTMSISKIYSYVRKSQTWNFKDIFFMVLLIGIEAYSRILGKLDFNFRDKNPFIWDISKSTKTM